MTDREMVHGSLIAIAREAERMGLGDAADLIRYTATAVKIDGEREVYGTLMDATEAELERCIPEQFRRPRAQ